MKNSVRLLVIVPNKLACLTHLHLARVWYVAAFRRSGTLQAVVGERGREILLWQVTCVHQTGVAHLQVRTGIATGHRAQTPQIIGDDTAIRNW
jgi:hypothetical protein